VLFVSMVSPHFPLTAPPEHFYKYAGKELPRPKLYDAAPGDLHPYAGMYQRKSNYGAGFNDDRDLNRALAGYFGLTSFLDEQVGKILAALAPAGLSDSTRVIYTSDHGDNLGARGLWGKANMYEESAGIPLLLSGADVPAAARCRTPVTLCDVSATILDAVGEGDAIAEYGLPGTSLLRLAMAPAEERVALSQFHTYGPDAFYMLRTLRHKYVHYINNSPELYDLEADPEELNNLASNNAAAGIRAEMEAKLRALLDPEAVDAQAKADQAAMIEHHGGEDALRKRQPGSYTPPPASAKH
jgi:choline-sulfatase